MADDIDYNWGFYTFMQANPGQQFLVCHGEPLEPDPIRFDTKGLFGIARRQVLGPSLTNGATLITGLVVAKVDRISRDPYLF